jgi:spore maturation protein CgeB
MKLARISSVYPSYWQNFYAAHPGLEQKSYDEQKAFLSADAFGLADNWKHALTKIGYDVLEIPANVEPLQKKWAHENSVEYPANNWQVVIAEAQLQQFRPDVLFMFDYSVFGRVWLDKVREALKVGIIIGWCGAPFREISVFKGYDLVLSCIPELVEKFRAMGHVSEHMHHAFDPRILTKLKPTQHEIDLSFIGQIVRANQFHIEREQLLEKIVEQTSVKIFTPGAEDFWTDFFKTQAKRSLYAAGWLAQKLGIPKSAFEKIPVMEKVVQWNEMPRPKISSKLRHSMSPAVFGVAMFQTLRDSKVTLNSHIDISPHSASNLRLFEATGVGTCLLTDWKSNLNSVFSDGSEVVSYRNADECAEKAKWLLENPGERLKIAEAGQRRCLRDHTFKQRAQQLDELIRNSNSNRSATAI